jgi:hypothetical protein
LVWQAKIAFNWTMPPKQTDAPEGKRELKGMAIVDSFINPKESSGSYGYSEEKIDALFSIWEESQDLSMSDPVPGVPFEEFLKDYAQMENDREIEKAASTASNKKSTEKTASTASNMKLSNKTGSTAPNKDSSTAPNKKLPEKGLKILEKSASIAPNTLQNVEKDGPSVTKGIKILELSELPASKRKRKAEKTVQKTLEKQPVKLPEKNLDRTDEPIAPNRKRQRPKTPSPEPKKPKTMVSELLPEDMTDETVNPVLVKKLCADLLEEQNNDFEQPMSGVPETENLPIASVPKKVNRQSYEDVKKRRKLQNVGKEHLKVNQDLLKHVEECGAKLDVDEQNRIAACILADHFGIPLAVGDFQTGDVFRAQKLVPEVVKALTRRKALTRITAKRAEKGVSALPSKSVSTKKTDKTLVLSSWSAENVNKLKELAKPEIVEQIQSSVCVSVDNDVSVPMFLDRLKHVASTQNLEELGNSVIRMRCTSSVAQQQQIVKKYITVAAALKDLSGKASKKNEVLRVIQATKANCSVSTLAENLFTLMSRFTPRILLCLPFICGFELENLGQYSPDNLVDLLDSVDFDEVSKTLLEFFETEGELLEKLFEDQ